MVVNTNLISRVGGVFTPLLKESIIDTGRITPEEFINAGDNLTTKFPSWSWQGVSELSRKPPLTFSWPLGQKSTGVSYLPPDKQYLLSKGILCLSRASAPNHVNETVSSDFTSFQSDSPLIDSDPDRYTKTDTQPCRRYDISITYDKYYQVPRNDAPLSPAQIFEDISAEHANKTVTLESHPFLPLSMASIHPCKHAPVMASMIKMLKEASGDGPEHTKPFDSSK